MVAAKFDPRGFTNQIALQYLFERRLAAGADCQSGNGVSSPFFMSRIYWKPQPKNLPELDLIKVQKESYEWFLKQGVKEALESISPITDFTGKNWQLDFLGHSLDEPQHTPVEAMTKGLTYDIPLRVKAKLTNLQTGDTTEQEVFMGDLPQMSETGTFIISGIERAVVNQLVRSPGVFFSGVIDMTTGRNLYQA